MAKIILITAAVILAMGWIAYGIWELRVRREEKRNPQPKPTTEHLKKVRKSFADYTKQMENYKLKPYERDEKKE